MVYESKKLIIATSMASELNVLAHELNRISESDRRFRDFTLDSLQEALREVVACFPGLPHLRRTATGWSELDERNRSTRRSPSALRRNPALEPSIFHFIRRMLLPERAPDVSEDEYQRRLRFAMKFQQYTGPVQAKGVEDTAFYRYAPLLSLNEVGGDPARFGRTVQRIPRVPTSTACRHWPLAMLATSTHDTKRGEDARAASTCCRRFRREWRVADLAVGAANGFGPHRR